MRRVFIGYCAQDKKWLERLQSHLKPLERDGLIEHEVRGGEHHAHAAFTELSLEPVLAP